MQPPVIATEPYGVLITISALLLQPLQFLVPTYLLALGQQQRDAHLRRCILAYLGVVAFNMLISLVTWWAMTLPPTSAARYATNACIYTLYLAVLVIAVRSCFEVNLWNALFCATAGYTIQNLGTGTGELVRLLVSAAAGAPLGTLAATVCADLATSCIIVLYYFIFIRYARGIGRLEDDSRSMLGMLVLVIMVVITFDVLIRGLERGGAQLGFLLALRVVHIAVCMFVLYSEGEALVNSRLRAEVATREALASERERQYELSRETIEAVNRRVHDIRHKVFRDLADHEVELESDVAQLLVRDIAVYDTQVKTGNVVLDTILSEKSLSCRRRGVAFSCIADGTALARLSAADLYGLFSILIDGAIAAVCNLDDEKQRSISLTLRRVGNLALLHVEHYRGTESAGEYAAAREIVERYGGTLSASQRDSAQVLDAMIPISS